MRMTIVEYERKRCIGIGIGVMSISLLVIAVLSNATDNTNVRRRLENDEGAVIWTMSYPQTGVTGFLELVHQSSQTTTATNYGHSSYNYKNELMVNAIDSVPIIEDRPNGPYRQAKHLPMPPNGILTRTHCNGYCIDCMPHEYVPYLTRNDLFLSECVKAIKYDGVTAKVSSVRYSSDLVKGIVIMMRNPWDNLISRFKHERRRNVANFGEKYSETPEGFHAWCNELDWETKHKEEEKQWYKSDEFTYATFVPCRAEFYRMVKWYNMAFRMADTLNVPTHILHVEALKNDPQEVLKRVYEFVNIEKYNFGNMKSFEIEDSAVDEYFDDKQKSFGLEFIKKVGEPQLKNGWRHYMKLKGDNK